MISVEEAISLIQENLPDFGDIFVSGDVLSGEITSEDLKADRDYPPFHRVMMDGIAINYNLWKEGKREFPINGICPAGEPAKTLSDSAAALEVMTGAPLPHGANLVIPYEHIQINDGIALITIELDRRPMDNVHLKSSDTREGEIVLKNRSELNGPNWGIAVSMGHSEVKTKRRPSVNIISTGDELVEIKDTPLVHQIRRSNAYALKASLIQHGYTEIELSHLQDDPEIIGKHFLENSKRFDLMLYSGGVSKGKFDYLPSVWKKMGVREIFHGVSQRPGKPLWFGTHHESRTIIIGLPGNPVSSLVCLHRYLLSKKKIYVSLTKEIIFKNDLTYFVPAKLESSTDGKLHAHPLPVQNSGEFTGLAESDGFIELPKDKTVFCVGETYLFHPWRRM